MSQFWDERFRSKTYVYGQTPNQYFAEQLKALPTPGRLLLPMEGEGRNAVFAAEQGWEVEAFDASKEGIRKARALAAERKVSFQYFQRTVEDFDYPPHRYDAIGLIFGHLSPELRPAFHQKLQESLKVGGSLIMELFHPDQLGRPSGGPKVIEMLYDPDLLRADFPGLTFKELKVQTITLDEGEYHQGEAVVTRAHAVRSQ
jgi:cyclopropane fatty-acyl-phospholipid synthase-like methyltransferase